MWCDSWQQCEVFWVATPKFMQWPATSQQARTIVSTILLLYTSRLYSLLWCRFTHYFKLHRQSGGGRVCRGLRRGVSAPWTPHADWLSPTKCLIKPLIKEFLNHGTNWTSILKSERTETRDKQVYSHPVADLSSYPLSLFTIEPHAIRVRT